MLTEMSCKFLAYLDQWWKCAQRKETYCNAKTIESPVSLAIQEGNVEDNPQHPVSILYKSIAGRYWPVRVADGPITARYKFIKNAHWAGSNLRQRDNC